jgi:hypothetical protein
VGTITSPPAFELIRIGLGGVLQNVGLVRFEVFTAVSMKNAVFWDVKTLFIFHRRHITSPLKGPAS